MYDAVQSIYSIIGSGKEKKKLEALAAAESGPNVRIFRQLYILYNIDEWRVSSDLQASR
jgi:hypothetical protein